MKTFEILKHLQADAIVLFMKVHNFHWNVKGTDFFNVHKATEEIYEEFADMFDDLAERIVQLGHHPLVTLSEALKLTRVKEETKTSFHSKDIFKEILGDYKHLEKEFKELSNTAEKEGDKVTVTYADDQLAKLQKIHLDARSPFGLSYQKEASMRDYSELEIFEGNPLDKWNDIIFHASKKLSKKELERLLELLALLETFIEKENLEEKFESFAKALRMDEELQQKIESRKTDIVIQSMANILSGNE